MKNFWMVVLGFFLMAGSASGAVQIHGAEATFPYPLYDKWISDFSKVDSNIQINYQSIGSGGGIRQFLGKTVDFGASDAPMTDEQIQKAGSRVLHIPTALGAVVLTYNVPGLNQGLKLSGETVADLFLGKISSWNDPKIQELNPGVTLPAKPVLIVHRSDGSGTTAVFADYLSKVSKEWKSKVGVGPSLSWPTGLGGKGNEGVTGLIKQTPGSLGYVELVYAKQNQMMIAQLKNKSGKFVEASTQTVSAAAKNSKKMPEDFRVSITDAEGADSYPISSFTYILIYGEVSGEKGKGLLKFLNWAISDGQGGMETLSYAPLPKALVSKVSTSLKSVKIQ